MDAEAAANAAAIFCYFKEQAQLRSEPMVIMLKWLKISLMYV